MKNEMYQMMCLDIYLSSINKKEESPFIGSPKKGAMAPLLSWDIHIENFHKLCLQAKQENNIREFKKIAKKLKIKNDSTSLFKNQEFDALVITDLQKKIVWVSDGFHEMTGYSKKFAINKSPSFLQGKDTSKVVKARINSKIKANQTFTDEIINYRKDKSTYTCEIKIIPLYSTEITHYLAIERQVV